MRAQGNIEALAEYDTVFELIPDVGDFDHNGHVDNVGVVRLLHVARSRWLLSLKGRPPGNIYVVRHLIVSYESEGFPDRSYRCGVRATDRGRRSLTLASTLTADDIVVATATAVHVCFDTNDRRPVEVWPEVVRDIEARQGAELPLRAG